jgi:hypothetical protein
MSSIATFFLKKDNIILELQTLGISKDEQERLLKMADEIAEVRLIDLILERLEERDKELFLEQLQVGASEVFIEFLRDKISDIESILTEQASVLENEIIEDIRSLKEGNND